MLCEAIFTITFLLAIKLNNIKRAGTQTSYSLFFIAEDFQELMTRESKLQKLLSFLWESPPYLQYVTVHYVFLKEKKWFQYDV